MEDLWRIVQSMRDAANQAGVSVVTGDTKVVDRGKGDGIYINTTGIGVIDDGVEISPQRARPGDLVLLSGAIAVHGITIMSVREGLEFETRLETDSAALHTLTAALLERGGRDVHVLRDPTRGGVASALNEIACEILGFDPLYVANEGKCIAIVAREVADELLQTMRDHPLGARAAIIGEVVEEHPNKVFLRSRIGGLRVVDMLSGEQLPRIC